MIAVEALAHAVHNDGAVDDLGDGADSVEQKSDHVSIMKEDQREKDSLEEGGKKTHVAASEKMMSSAEPLPPAAAPAMMMAK